MPAERGPSDFAETARSRGDFDELPQYSIERRRARSISNWPAVVGLTVTVVIQFGAIAWYGGQLAQRQINTDAANDRQDREIQRQNDTIREITNENNRQAQTIAGTNVAYLDIVRRLESIERKIDQHR